MLKLIAAGRKACDAFDQYINEEDGDFPTREMAALLVVVEDCEAPGQSWSDLEAVIDELHNDVMVAA